MDANGRASLCVALARLAGGDRSAQRPVFDALWPVLKAFCRRMVADPADAEDAAQKTVIRLFEQATDYEVERDALAWALELALWECRTTLRRRSRSHEGALSPAALGVADPAESPEASAARAELEQALAASLSTLSQVDRSALVDGLTGATWRKRRERALTRLKLLWRSEHGD
ncbi:MAG: sigma-70 family RNA polymerase sigma factor [Archangiaceae bacterium]|nr:sigma-70 family RNA polymerase sigma factor [Archangiaceae bacterium]